MDISQLIDGFRGIYGQKKLTRAVSGSPDVKADEFAKYRHDPVLFAREVLDWHPTEDQERILRSFPGRVKANSGHGIGKSSVAAVLAIWWYCTRNPGVVVITAPTKDHVETVLWAEVRMLLARMKLKYPGKLLPKA